MKTRRRFEGANRILVLLMWVALLLYAVVGGLSLVKGCLNKKGADKRKMEGRDALSGSAGAVAQASGNTFKTMKQEMERRDEK